MQEINTSNTISLSLELFHVQTNTSFDLPSNSSTITIGKPNDDRQPDIDISNLPDADVVSRTHAQIQITGSIYFFEDLGSSNGTFINNTKIEPRTPHLLNLGDRIDLGQGSKVTFLFQYKQHRLQNFISKTNPTVIQPHIASESEQPKIDKTSRLVGSGLIVAGILILIRNIQIGIFVGLPAIIICLGGVYILFQQRINRSLGWVLLAVGIGMIVLTSNIFASGNLLAIISSFVLLIAGYRLMNTGKIMGYDWRSLHKLIKK